MAIFFQRLRRRGRRFHERTALNALLYMAGIDRLRTTLGPNSPPRCPSPLSPRIHLGQERTGLMATR